jgi:hypothetical protein|tara:strand:- start:550 stop:1458 length:909 start_codon:yes stop_codon:yes gene_type:complete
MTSSINPNNIDTTYPIAGQDNDSQGFRDNFTNIKTNFEYAETEIDDLQAKGIFKSALTGTVLDNDMAGAVIKNTKTQAYRATRIALGAVTGSAAIDYSAGNWYSVTTSGSITLAFSNIPAAGNQAFITVTVTVANIAHTMTLPSAVGNSASAKSIVGIQGIVSNVITFKEAGTYEFQFHTDDGGASIFLSELTRPRDTLTNPIKLTGSEDLAAAGAASLTLTSSFFTTAAAETATLAAGVEGQVKVFAMVADGGDMVITIANAGWKASGTGTITFDTIGDAATMMYINSKWFCIGNNGATFA